MRWKDHSAVCGLRWTQANLNQLEVPPMLTPEQSATPGPADFSLECPIADPNPNPGRATP